MRSSRRAFSGCRMLFEVVRHTASYRRRSEDRVAIHEVPGGLVVVLADGAGGASGGVDAAELCIRAVVDALADRSFEPDRASAWAAALRRADRSIARDGSAGETTAVVVGLFAGCIVGASAGDSVARVFLADGHDDLTSDQEHRLRLGSGKAVPVAFERCALNGTLVVASDGLFAHASDEAIRMATRAASLEDAATNLVQAARTPAGKLLDDLALVLVRRTS